MAGKGRMAVVKKLAAMGLRKTLVAGRNDRGYTVGRVRRTDEGLEIAPVARFDSDTLPIIGRVGVPDPQLGVSWKGTMTFYGRWFDELGETDAGYHLRRNISGLSRDRLLEQIRRDDQYALVGSYYSVFQTILEVKHRVPLVFIDDRHLSLVSFPVLLADIPDTGLADKLTAMLHVMLKADESKAGSGPRDPDDTGGIEVDELPPPGSAG